ncbi:phasin family protein [Algimonas porphyrae]|uniref:Phasin family protein n=1 Tax=Algimonas porphyrae TaxID=1128113 RepID=A0ABQ5V6J1_9PROT|nr:phasin family protein [Algimonas porphyrae]GLQ21892.1 hypothetical protein GCM10007854_28470 [Algimonas porphyrae]
MADDKQSKKTTDMARRIWLAGIGAYGKAFEDGRDAIRGLSGELSGKTSDVFETLAEKGEQLETAAKIKGAELAGKASGLGSELQSNLAIDERIQAMRDRLSGSQEDRVDALEARLAAMEAKLDLLIKQTATTKRATPTKTTTTRTRKAPAKKAAPKKTAKKTTAKKTAVKKPATKKAAAKTTTSKK